MRDDSFWARLKRARVFQVVVVYLGASWGVLEVADLLQDSLGLPEWVVPVALLLLAIGLLIILATAWVQSLPATRDRTETGELPGAWDIAPGGIWTALKEGELPHLTWGRTILGGVAALWLLFGFAGLYVIFQDRGETFAPADLAAGEAAEGIAIVPFTTHGQELDIWREGMVDLFTMSLDGVGGYRTIDSRTVMARWRDMVGDQEGTEPDLATVREVARQAGARYVMTGTVVALGDDLRLQAELVDVESGDDIGAGRVQGPVDSVSALVDRLSVEVAENLLRAGGSEVLTAHRAASRTTSSLPALKAYLEGEAYFRRANFSAAGEAYERAIVADSTFALAHVRLSQAYGWEGGGSERGLEHARAAARMVDGLSSRDRAIVESYIAYSEADVGAIDEVKRTAHRYPDDPEAQFMLGEFYFHYGSTLLVDLAETRDALEATIELDPNFGPSYVHAIELAIVEGDTAATQAMLDRYRGVTGSDTERLGLAADLTFGDSLEQANARAAVDTISDRLLAWLVVSLWFHTRRPAALLPAAEELHARDGGWLAQVVWLQFNARKLEERRERSSETMPDWLPSLNDYEAWRWAGGPEPPADAVFSPSVCAENLYCSLGASAWRIDRDEAVEALDVAENLRAVGDSLRAAGDSVYGNLYGRAADALGAYALSVTESPAAAIEALEPLTKQRRDTADWYIRVWLADLNREEGRLRDAIPYYESVRRDRLVAYGAFRLGQIYEELDRPDEAVNAYRTFLQAWEEADPDLPWLDEARASLEGLLSEQG